MNKGIFKYQGYLNGNYLFVDKNGKETRFSKCRKELIDSFKLNKSDNINEWFNINYFTTKAQNRMDNMAGLHIVSDMEIVRR